MDSYRMVMLEMDRAGQRGGAWRIGLFHISGVVRLACPPPDATVLPQ